MMDWQLRQLKRATQSNPDDVAGLHRYIAALERVIGGADPKPPKRRGWKCVETGSFVPSDVPIASPDGVCAYFSDLREDGRRTVSLIIDGEPVDWLLPESYEGDGGRESEDWCIFCGEPEERK